MLSLVNTIMVGAFWVHYFIILLAVYILKEKIAWQPKPFSMLDSYPWICRKCLTTWTLVASYISVGFILTDPLYAIFGVILGAATGFAMNYTDNERIKAEDGDDGNF